MRLYLAKPDLVYFEQFNEMMKEWCESGTQIAPWFLNKPFESIEDFEKFMDAFDEVLDYVDEHNGEAPAKDKDPELDADKFTSVDYDDLDK